MPTAAQSKLSVTALLPQKADRISLAGVFSHSNWKLDVCETLREARVRLPERGSGVVICDSVVPDGDWQDLLSALPAKEPSPRLIVALATPDPRVWAEIIDLGGYDAIVKPFEREEVVRIVSLAWLSWREAVQASAPKAKPAHVQGLGRLAPAAL